MGEASKLERVEGVVKSYEVGLRQEANQFKNRFKLHVPP